MKREATAMTNIEKIMQIIKELKPANVRKVLIYAKTLKEIQDWTDE